MDLGVGVLKLHDIDKDRANRLSADLQARFGKARCEISVSPEEEAPSASGIVNATPIGMRGYPGTPIDPAVVRPEQFVADVIYSPLETELLRAAKARGAKVMGGAGMCVHQAVDAFRLFNGGGEADRQRMHRTFVVAAARRDKT
jgi:shikimate dehydrogenase